MTELPRPPLEYVRIRREHVPALLEIEKNAYVEPWTEGMFLQEVDNPLSQFFVAFLYGGIVGYVGYWEAIDEAHITSVTVRKEYQGCGFGREELTFLLDVARQRGIREATLEVRSSNVRAQNLYRSLGFRQIGLRKKYYSGTGEDALVMVLEMGQEAEVQA